MSVDELTKVLDALDVLGVAIGHNTQAAEALGVVAAAAVSPLLEYVAQEG